MKSSENIKNHKKRPDIFFNSPKKNLKSKKNIFFKFPYRNANKNYYRININYSFMKHKCKNLGLYIENIGKINEFSFPLNF